MRVRRLSSSGGSTPMEANDYLQQVVQEQAQVEQELRRKAPVAAPAAARPRKRGEPDSRDFETTSAAVGGTFAANYRVTGWWRWKTVVVPPNAHVVHTRRGAAEPLHVGLGISFRYDPATDAFLVIPAA